MMAFKLLLIVFVVMASVTPGLSQDDTTQTGGAIESPAIKRYHNSEFIIGMQFASITGGWSHVTYRGTEYDTVTLVQQSFIIGFGGHAPIATLGKTTSLSFVYQALLIIGTHSINSSFGSSHGDGTFGVSLPLFLTVGTGALRRREYAWGVEGGLGISPVILAVPAAVTIVPSAIAEVSYAPNQRKMYRLQFIANLTAFTAKPAEGPDQQHHVWSMSFVLGL